MVFLPQRHEIPLHPRPRDRRWVYSKARSAGSNLPDLTAPERYRLNRVRLDRRFTSYATNWANHYASRCANCPTRRYAIRRYATNFPRPAAVRLRLTAWLVRRVRRPPREWQRAARRPLGSPQARSSWDAHLRRTARRSRGAARRLEPGRTGCRDIST